MSWDNGASKDAGAATWGSGITGVVGVVSPANSLVGTTANDSVGVFVTGLTNGNYVVGSQFWDNGAAINAGAATWGSGTTGIVGIVSPTNSLVGMTAGDMIGSYVTPLRNGNFVASSQSWDNGAAIDAGAATWGNGTTGIVGAVSAINSLVGSKSGDRTGHELTPITALQNGNYVVRSASWVNGAPNAGAVTLGNGTSGTIGFVNETNSLVGKRSSDRVGSGGVVALRNGNYVVGSPDWDNETLIDTGAATWSNGTTGIVGFVSPANSLLVGNSNDSVGRNIKALTNGNYVVSSPYWDNGLAVDVGAVTWGNGSTGIVGMVNVTNSLVGSTAFDYVGDLFNNIEALSNGNYVVGSPNWNNGAIPDAGAATWGNGSTGIVGVVSPANSLVGRKSNDRVGLNITALRNGNYLVSSPYWSNGAATSAGAVTWGNGSTGTVVAVSATNSIVGGKTGDQVGSGGITVLANGNYVVRCEFWYNATVKYAGAATLGRGTARTFGVVSPTNSLVGLTANSKLGTIIPNPVNNAFYARFINEAGGRVRVGITIFPA